MNDKRNYYKAFELYIARYGHLYPKAILEDIKRTFVRDMYEEELTNEDVMNQIYAEIGLLTGHNNLYDGFVELLEKRHNIYCNVADIGVGFFPNVSKSIDAKQRAKGKGSITAYDPKLVPTELGNIKLVKKKVRSSDSLEDVDLVTLILACEAMLMMIKKANQERKAVFAAFCGCIHFPASYIKLHNPTVNDWYRHAYGEIKRTLPSDGKIIVDYLEPKYRHPYPVLSVIYEDREKVMKKGQNFN